MKQEHLTFKYDPESHTLTQFFCLGCIPFFINDQQDYDIKAGKQDLALFR
jgi:hypothetical protein